MLPEGGILSTSLMPAFWVIRSDEDDRCYYFIYYSKDRARNHLGTFIAVDKNIQSLIVRKLFIFYFLFILSSLFCFKIAYPPRATRHNVREILFHCGTVEFLGESRAPKRPFPFHKYTRLVTFRITKKDHGSHRKLY
jgi:hypothetical protein